MNTNSNAYTVIYTTIIVVIVAAVLAFVAMTLKPKQDANIKAETVSQMLAAAQFGSKTEISAKGNDAVLALYKENIEQAYVVDAKGAKIRDLDIAGIELIDNLKAQNVAIKDGGDVTLPVYVFKGGITVIPCYGAGLWGPIWGYLAFKNGNEFVGAYFDHESETPGLGAKIKDEPWFREQFPGKVLNLNSDNIFRIVKGGAPAGDNSAVDAITGATMTCKGLNEALAVWLAAYKPFLSGNGAAVCSGNCQEHKCSGECKDGKCKDGKCAEGNCSEEKCKEGCDHQHAAAGQCAHCAHK